MLFIGDVHGEIEKYYKIIEGYNESIQVGDVGLGFAGVELDLPDGHKFIRGNHDDPDKCRSNKSYLGDWGYIEENDLFFISGAYSIDQHLRTPGVSWWSEEELSYQTLKQLIDIVPETKPRIIVSHDCPTHLQEQFFGFTPKTNRTGSALSCIFEKYQPSIWIFGHHHVNYSTVVNGTRFICLDSLCSMVIDV